MDDRIITVDTSSATVAEAAEALGTEEARIAKTLSFKLKDRCILIVVKGDVKIDNAKYKHTFGYVLLFHVIFWIVAVVLFGLAACLFIHSDFSNVLDFVESIPRWLRRTILILPLATLFCTMWWYIYRMYCRAQITTRRNP